MAGPDIFMLCKADTCASQVHPVFNIVAPFRYLLPTVHLFMVDIENFSLLCVLLSDLDLSCHHPPLLGAAPAIQRVLMSGLPKKGKSNPHCWGCEVSTQFTQQPAKTFVTALPLVGCVVWSLVLLFFTVIT